MPDEPRQLTVIEGDAEGELVLRHRTLERRPCIIHRHLVLDHGARTVSCDDCGHAVDPFDGLTSLEAHLDRYVQQGEALRREARRIAAEVEDLKRQRRNLRAQVRRATR